MADFWLPGHSYIEPTYPLGKTTFKIPCIPKLIYIGPRNKGCVKRVGAWPGPIPFRVVWSSCSFVDQYRSINKGHKQESHRNRPLPWDGQNQLPGRIDTPGPGFVNAGIWRVLVNIPPE